MKRNAIIRIILWSVVLVVLLAFAFILIYVPGAGLRMHKTTVEETMVPVPLVTSPPDTTAPESTTVTSKSTDETAVSTNAALQEQYNAITVSNLNIRTNPSAMAATAGMLEKGEALLVTKQELVEEILWGYIESPVSGWVMMDYVQLQEPLPEEPPVIDSTEPQKQNVQGYSVALDAASIRNMEIEWAAGTILIQPEDITEIRITEEGSSRETDAMVWKVRDGTLFIQYSKNTDHAFGMGLLRDEHAKDLLIQVPLDWSCNSLEIDAASASLQVNDLTIREMEFDGASGTCAFNNCAVDILDLDTASGDVRFDGSLTQLECDCASANIILALTKIPRSIDLDTASGDLDITLPKDAGFTVSLDSMSSSFESDFATVNRNGAYVAGDGRCRIDVDAMSGDVIIRQSQ